MATANSTLTRPAKVTGEAPAYDLPPLKVRATRSHRTSPRAGVPVHSSAPSHAFTPDKTDGITRQQAIENALCMALFHVRTGDTVAAIRTATAKAIRAASMLKQACTEFANSGRD